MKCVPKSYAQARGEVKVTADFLNNFAGDNVRRLAKVRITLQSLYPSLEK
jgi:1-pyrroline-5-carboxylate dehydrogenase